MDGFVLLIDDLGRVEAVLERALGGTGLKVESFTDPGPAKRRLIESAPLLIVSRADFQNHPEGGFRLAAEVSSHEQLASIPFVIIADQLSEDVIRRAAESGAKSLIPWPVTVDSLKNRLRPYLGESLPVVEEKKEPEFPSPGGGTSALRQEKAAELAPSGGAEQKIHMAQQLLAKVLHNLKTSALLEVVDLEDVPRVVMEITRSVCGSKVPEQKAVEKPEPKPELKPEAPPQRPALSGDVSLDLDSVFGRKK